jgi:hypothetical protein
MNGYGPETVLDDPSLLEATDLLRSENRRQLMDACRNRTDTNASTDESPRHVEGL